MKYEFVLAHRGAHSVVTLCRVLRCSRGGFYRWLTGPRSKREVSDEKLLAQMEVIHKRHRGHAGAVKTWRVLNDEGVSCGKHQVARIRRNHGIFAKRRHRYVVTTKSKSTQWYAPNLLARQFSRKAPNLAWVGDVTSESLAERISALDELDGLINNAGTNRVGPMEQQSPENIDLFFR